MCCFAQLQFGTTTHFKTYIMIFLDMNRLLNLVLHPLSTLISHLIDKYFVSIKLKLFKIKYIVTFKFEKGR